ncbi:hypothetical protein [Kribbella sp. VKM Ac-2566]|uniref:hypothetical protein n=1 Tax=Kribbella sp. VKM Ac-2566 TaxID=2512218 RepID=UPI001EDE9C09|nr:hypothetical protein [Kribbella sp. VKM Ac-2566]
MLLWHDDGCCLGDQVLQSRTSEWQLVLQPARLAPLRRAEARYVWAHYATGAVREFYHRADKLGAVLMLEVADIQQTARQVLEELPMLQAGLLTREVVQASIWRLTAQSRPKHLRSDQSDYLPSFSARV